MLRLRPMTADDKPAVMRILQRTPEFLPEEIPVAEEVCDTYLADPAGAGYQAVVAEIDSEVVGYICFGPTPLTRGTWDIYWMAVSPEKKGQGIGTSLLAHAEALIKEAVGRLILIETSGESDYANTRAFYRARGYEPVGSIPDYYAPGLDLIIFQKRLPPHPCSQ